MPELGSAEKALICGLSPSSAICPRCEFRESCEYQSRLTDAELAPHRIVTHSRAALTFADVASGRKFITIHEDPTGLLRPIVEISYGLETIAKIAYQANQNAGEYMNSRYFFTKMERIAMELSSQMAAAKATQPIELPLPAHKPHSAEADLLRAIDELEKGQENEEGQENSVKLNVNGDAMRIVRDLAAGRIVELAIIYRPVRAKDGTEAMRAGVVAVYQTELPNDAPVWINDATGQLRIIELLAGRKVIDKTPLGVVDQIHSIIQHPIDVKKSTSTAVVLKILRAALDANPSASQVGLICDKKHLSIVDGTAKGSDSIEQEYRQRLAKIEYFRSGANRGSNVWIEKCDLILVLGTPRVPPNAVANRLIQYGMIPAAMRDGAWGYDWWSGVTRSGKRITVRTHAYRDHDWHAAHILIVHAELIQAAGRGRAVCENGVPVIVLTTEPLGFPLADPIEQKLQPLSRSAMEILEAIRLLAESSIANDRASAIFPNIYLLGNLADNQAVKPRGFSTKAIASKAKTSERTARRLLGDLEDARRVVRIGKRGGWLLVADVPVSQNAKPVQPGAVAKTAAAVNQPSESAAPLKHCA